MQCLQISVFADDILIYLSNPESSIFKLLSPSQNISSSIQLDSDLDYMKHLAVNMYDLNFNPLNQKIKEDIKRWNLIPVLNFSVTNRIIKNECPA